MLLQHGRPQPRLPSLPPSLTPPRCAWLLFFDLCPSLAGGRSRCPELANNNQGVALCDTPSLGLDNDQAADGRYAGEWQPLHRGPLRERGSLRVRMRRPSQRSSHPPTRPRHISSPCEHANTQLKLTQAGRFVLCFSSSSKSWPMRLQFLVQRLFFVLFFQHVVVKPLPLLFIPPPPSALCCFTASSASISCASSPL